MLEQNKTVLSDLIPRSWVLAVDQIWLDKATKEISELQLQYRQVPQTANENWLQEYDLTLLEASKFFVWIVSA